MATATVRGVGGTTVTITLGSAANAAGAQAALGEVSGFVELGILAQVPWTGGTVPAAGALLGGLVVGGAGGDAGALQANFVSAVVEALGPSTVVGPFNANATVAAGGGGLTFLNLSQAAEVFLGGADYGVFQGRSGAGATVGVDGTVVVGALDGVSGAGMTVNAHDGALVLVAGHGDNAVAVNGQAGASIVSATEAAVGDAAVTVRGGVGGAVQHLALGGGAFINPGAGDATVFGNVGGGTATVFGGSFGGATAAAFTGKLTVVEGRGVFFGGSAGGNLMSTAVETGAATLVGGGSGDLLISQGAGHVLIAGAGAETLSGFSVEASVGGATFFAGGGNATIFGNSGGGNAFGLGAGVSQVDGRNEAALAAAGLGQGAANTFYVTTASGGGHVVGDFIAGFDRFDLALTTAVTGQVLDELRFFAIDDASPENPFAGSGHAGTELTLSGGTKVYFFDTQVTLADLGVVALPG